MLDGALNRIQFVNENVPSLYGWKNSALRTRRVRDFPVRNRIMVIHSPTVMCSSAKPNPNHFRMSQSDKCTTNASDSERSQLAALPHSWKFPFPVMISWARRTLRCLRVKSPLILQFLSDWRIIPYPNFEANLYTLVCCFYSFLTLCWQTWDLGLIS